MAKILLALDFGGTKLAAAVAGLGEYCLRRKAAISSPPEKGADADRRLMLKLARQVLEGLAPAAIGVSFGGPVRAREGKVLLSHHVPGWEGFSLQAWLEELFSVPVVVDNDANLAALGEWHFGAGKGCRSLFYVTVSTGIGGGWVLGGRVYHGVESLAGEIGHMTIRPEGPVCTCGRRGCLEALSSGSAIARRAQERLAATPTSSSELYRLVGGDLAAITARDVSRAAITGDSLALKILREAADALGRGIASAITLMNPDRVVIGGGVIKAGPQYLRWVEEAALRDVLPELKVEIVRAALGDEAPLWGAVALAQGILGMR